MIQQTGKYIIFTGIILILVGLAIHFGGGRMRWFGHLPGDIRIEKENVKFYFPVTTMILLSLLLTLIVNIIRKFF